MKFRKGQRVYVVGGCFDTVEGESFIGKVEDKQTGVVGYCPMFTNKKKARKFAGKKYSIIEMEIVL